MTTSILFAVNNSMSSRAALDFLIALPLCPEEVHITLIHVFRKPSTSEELMGEKFTAAQPSRYMQLLQQTREKLVEKGFDGKQITINLVAEPYPTVADGIIDQFNQGRFDLVILGRKRMSKAEEFVLGDPSIKVVRALQSTAVLVVKCQ